MVVGGGGRPGEKGAGGVWEAGEEGAGSGRKREELCNIAQYFAIKNVKRREPTNTGWELGLKGMGSGRFKPPYPPPTQCNGAWWLPPTGLSWLPDVLGSIASGSTILSGTFPKLIYC